VSAALPFGVFDELLKDPCNAMPAAELQALFTSAGVGQLSAAQLEQARAIAMRVRPTNTARAAIEAAMACAGLPVPADEGRWGAAFSAIARVWASKWNERAYVSCRKAGIDHSLLQMAVLIQEVVQPQYAFVLHTVNPVTGDAGEIYGELVCGLGETLVGNYPGRALSFSAPKSDLRSPRTLGFPSKAVALLCPETLIFRSDSNGEDLEGYAGAGLYDSVTMDAAYEARVDYSRDAIVLDATFRRDMLARIVQVGAAVEEALGVPQDIEGVVREDGAIFVVQTRPQV
jgi:alpha-glucan,water dikinase